MKALTGQQKSSAGKGAARQAWSPERKLWNPGEERSDSCQCPQICIYAAVRVRTQ